MTPVSKINSNYCTKNTDCHNPNATKDRGVIFRCKAQAFWGVLGACLTRKFLENKHSRLNLRPLLTIYQLTSVLLCVPFIFAELIWWLHMMASFAERKSSVFFVVSTLITEVLFKQLLIRNKLTGGYFSFRC